ncbi:ORF81 [Anguillid herpesvirus 1]|uniref:Protein ORF81 n=1 Tax=Anguillid herpesvirus 1 TaxID=150286 RepID=A0A8E5ALX7_9VIRU|nr:protein ORF81 [Anguillid herpesvirus 1]QRM16766.1 protein ORF81 [Anguillid herpesvirus 1]QRM16896.1 protein ORF81 [Anguillid herpesvirus 1]QRM17027.1 protein ORF81 [Anguillid herpesvirus 1]QRM17158.1 protein ORF81 [Anguillid herpesvirus 1]
MAQTVERSVLVLLNRKDTKPYGAAYAGAFFGHNLVDAQLDVNTADAQCVYMYRITECIGEIEGYPNVGLFNLSTNPVATVPVTTVATLGAVVTATPHSVKIRPRKLLRNTHSWEKTKGVMCGSLQRWMNDLSMEDRRRLTFNFRQLCGSAVLNTIKQAQSEYKTLLGGGVLSFNWGEHNVVVQLFEGAADPADPTKKGPAVVGFQNLSKKHSPLCFSDIPAGMPALLQLVLGFRVAQTEVDFFAQVGHVMRVMDLATFSNTLNGFTDSRQSGTGSTQVDIRTDYMFSVVGNVTMQLISKPSIDYMFEVFDQVLCVGDSFITDVAEKITVSVFVPPHINTPVLYMRLKTRIEAFPMSAATAVATLRRLYLLPGEPCPDNVDQDDKDIEIATLFTSPVRCLTSTMPAWMTPLKFPIVLPEQGISFNQLMNSFGVPVTHNDSAPLLKMTTKKPQALTPYMLASMQK